MNALTQVASNDDASKDTLTSALGFFAVSGTTYEIAVDGFAGQSGTIVLAWILGPANDDFANAEAIVGSTGTVSGSNRRATAEAGEPLPWEKTPHRFGTAGQRPQRRPSSSTPSAAKEGWIRRWASIAGIASPI